MFTSGSKYYFGLSLYAYLAAVIYGAASGDHGGIISMVIGPLTLGYKGAVGDHVGYTILIGLSIVAFFLGCVVVAFRDDNAEAVAQVAHTEVVPETPVPRSTSYVPIFSAFGVAIVLVGLVAGSPLFLLGVVILAMVTVEWAVKAWSDRATGDAAVNQRIRDRVMHPVEIPIIGAIVIAFVVLGFSRVLLSLSEIGSDIVFGAVPTIILIVGVVIATREKVSKNVVIGLLLLGGLLVLAAGVLSAAVGERDFEEHHETGGHEALAPPSTTQLIVRIDR